MSPIYQPCAILLSIHVSWRRPGCHDVVFLGKQVDTWTLYNTSAWPQVCCQSALCCFRRYTKCSNALHIERDLTELQAEVDAFELYRWHLSSHTADSIVCSMDSSRVRHWDGNFHWLSCCGFWFLSDPGLGLQ